MRDPKTEKELTNPAGTPAWVQWGYRGLFNLGLGLSAPYYARRMAKRGGWKDRLGQRFGRYDTSFIQRCQGQTNLWFHAVSVGEVLLSVPLVKRLENKLPSVQWILSATTTTGNHHNTSIGRIRWTNHKSSSSTSEGETATCGGHG